MSRGALPALRLLPRHSCSRRRVGLACGAVRRPCALRRAGRIRPSLLRRGPLRQSPAGLRACAGNCCARSRPILRDGLRRSLLLLLSLISSATEFNSVKLLDGTYNDKAIQIGTGPNQTFKLGINATDAATLGAYEMQTTTEANAVDSSTAMGAVGTHASAKTALDALFDGAADYVVKGSFGTKTANIDAGADARDVAKAFNLISGTTGVQASVVTRAKISSISGADTYSFTLQGKSTNESTVNATISSTSNLTELKDAINSVSGSTGITASLTEDLSGINLVQNEGYDIIIGGMTAATTHTSKAIADATNNYAASGAASNITLTAHGFAVGDTVQYYCPEGAFCVGTLKIFDVRASVLRESRSFHQIEV